jgi:hypothetical protein
MWSFESSWKRSRILARHLGQHGYRRVPILRPLLEIFSVV